ncbi:hypothetical protein OTR29_04250 [Rickettsia endosymbiont of Halotydeus destructor]
MRQNRSGLLFGTNSIKFLSESEESEGGVITLMLAPYCINNLIISVFPLVAAH